MPMSNDTELRKALSTLSATTGDKLIPEVVSEGIRRFVEDASPLYSIIRKIPWSTNSYIFRELNALPTATFRADEASLPSRTRGTYEKRSTAMKYIYSTGEVTGPVQAATGNVLNALQYEIELHATALIRELERTIVNGDDSVDADEFDGLKVQITLSVNGGSVPLTLATLESAFDLSATYPTHIITTRAHSRRINQLLQAQQRFVDSTTVAAGFRVYTYNGLPIIPVDNDAAADLSTVVLLPDMNKVLMPVSQDITFEPLAKTKDSDDFMLKMYCTLAVEGAARHHVKIINAPAA
jgi:HK97 family phage major capsid protein